MKMATDTQTLKYLPLLGMLIITAQLAASVLGPRTISVGPFLLPGGIWSFPLTFFMWDIVTEVYGFKRARQLIWYYLFAQIIFAFLVDFGLQMPAAKSVAYPQLYSMVLGNILKITISMVIAIICGDFVNCYILDRMRFLTNGKYLWMRLIGATALGELMTSIIWVVAFYSGTNLHPNLWYLIVSQYIIKILIEIALVPVTYLIVNFLKKNENLDFTRRYTNFDPYTLELV